MAKNGIDISKWNGTVNFQKLKQSQDFVFIRIGYGISLKKDEKYEANVRGCEQAGIPYGIYFFSYACNLDQAKTEMDTLIPALKGTHASYPIVIDMEDDGYKKRHGNPSFQTLANITYYECKRLEEAGYYAMYYASKDWHDNMLKYKSGLNTIDFWLAHWGISKPSTSCGVWQYTSKGKVEGINGYCDQDISYKDYPLFITDGKPTPKKKNTHTDEVSYRFYKYEKGTFRFDAPTHVRELPTIKAKIVATYKIGEKVSYDRVYLGDGYVWISYIGRSGNRRYTAIRPIEKDGHWGKPWGRFV